MRKKAGAMAIVLLFLSAVSAVSALNAFAEEYYADIEVFVADSGLVTITGETDHPSLIVENSPDFTSKDGRYWLLNISYDEKFSDLVFALHLPKNTAINYMKTPSLARIESNGGISIIGTGEDSPLTLVVQYQIGRYNGQKKEMFFPAAAFIFLIFGAIAYYIIRKKIISRTCLSYNKYALTTRQKQIIDILKKSRSPITQAAIEKETGLPKSSLSRNIDSLVKKKILIKESRGMSNIIALYSGEQKSDGRDNKAEDKKKTDKEKLWRDP